MNEAADRNSAETARSARRADSRWLPFALLGLLATALLGSVLLIYQTVEAERDEREQVRRNSEILLELRNISHAALNAESGQRGYLITLDRGYLESYHAGREQYPRAIARLRELMAREATQRQRELLEEITNLADSKFRDAEETVALVESGALLDARRRVLSDEGHDAMLQLRAALREMERIENRILSEASSETARAEGRVLPLLAALFALMLLGVFLGYKLVGRTARAEAEAAQAAELAAARDRADLLARELNHRVKNLFAVVLAIVQMSGRDTPEAKPVVQRIGDRIRALLTAHEVTQGALDRPYAQLESLIETTLAPYRSEELIAELSGPEVEVPASKVTPLGLVLHELTTNAVKYGCWSRGGRLRVEWETRADELRIDWAEICGEETDTPKGEGFGSMLMNSAARQLGGQIEREFTPRGAKVLIVFPLAE